MTVILDLYNLIVYLVVSFCLFLSIFVCLSVNDVCGFVYIKSSVLI